MSCKDATYNNNTIQTLSYLLLTPKTHQELWSLSTISYLVTAKRPSHVTQMKVSSPPQRSLICTSEGLTGRSWQAKEPAKAQIYELSRSWVGGYNSVSSTVPAQQLYIFLFLLRYLQKDNTEKEVATTKRIIQSHGGFIVRSPQDLRPSNISSFDVSVKGNKVFKIMNFGYWLQIGSLKIFIASFIIEMYTMC